MEGIAQDIEKMKKKNVFVFEIDRAHKSQNVIYISSKVLRYIIKLNAEDII